MSARLRSTIAVALAAVLIGGSIAAFRFVTADPGARSVYNLDADSSTYDSLARQIDKTGSVRLIPAYWPPGFILWLAGVYAIAGPSYLAAKIVGWALLMLMAVAAAALLWQRAGPWEGFFAGASTISSPILVAYAATLQYEILAAFATTLIVVVLSARPGRMSAQLLRALAIGSLCGWAALIREPLVFVFPVALVVIVARERARGSIGRSVMPALVMTSVFAIVVASWSIVQYQQTGRLIVLSDKSDINFRIGNNPRANGTYNAQLNGIGEPSGWSFVTANPRRTAALAVRKLGYFWGLRRDPWTIPREAAVVLERASLGLMPLQWSEWAWNASILALFVIGAAMSFWTANLWPAAVIVLCVMGAHVVYFGAQRFAVPVDVLVSMVISLPLAALARLAVRRRAIAAAIGILALWILGSQFASAGALYHVEAEDLEGLSAENIADPLAANGIARHAAAAGGARQIAFLSGIVFPEGAFRARIHARVSDCARADAPALTLSIRDQARQPKQTAVFTVADLCGPTRYRELSSIGSLRADEAVYL